MKIVFLHIFNILLFLTIFISCTRNENHPENIIPGDYTIQKFIHAINNETQSRGINNANDNFDEIYDYEYVYLHIVGSQNSLYIPLYRTNCGTKDECYCFSYNIKVLENGDAIVTPIDNQGKLASYSLTIPNGSKCYFSSIQENIWKLDEKQIYPKQDYVFYQRDDKTNKEIYRSEENYRITDLTNSVNDIIMGRACTAFTVLCLLYDGEEMSNKVGGLVTLTEEEFQKHLNSPSNKWYIKIYLGGNSFITEYNIGTMDKEGDNEFNYGYYSTGNFYSDPDQKIYNCQFNQFSENEATYTNFYYYGIGYKSNINIRLLTPTLKNDLVAYVLIKKWEGSGEPTEEWLASDKDALYTKIKLAEYTKPENGYFYILGLLLDVEEFNRIWLEKTKQKEDAAQTSPASRTANGMHYFELKDAKVIVEKY